MYHKTSLCDRAQTDKSTSQIYKYNHRDQRNANATRSENPTIKDRFLVRLDIAWKVGAEGVWYHVHKGCMESEDCAEVVGSSALGCQSYTTEVEDTLV